MAKRRRNWDWPRISGWFVLLFAPARADARFARTKGDYVRMLLQCLLGIAALLLPRVLHALSGAMLGALGIAIAGYLSRTRGKGNRSTRPERHKRRARENFPRPPLVLPSALQHLARALLGDRVDQGADAAARLAVRLLQHGPVLVQKGDDVAPVVGHGELEPAVQVLQA